MVRTPYHQEQLTEGLLYQKYEPHIHSLTFTDMKNETVDAAFNLIIKLDERYAEEGNHIQYMYVLEDVQYTPYLLTKIKQSLNLLPENLVHSSVVVADTFLAKVLQNIVLPKIDKAIEQEVYFFTTEDEAFAWLDARRKTIGK